MVRPKKQDPYSAFKDDRERRRALNVRDASLAVAAVSLMDSTDRLVGFLQTLKVLLTQWP